jgi:hypothetical protein
VKVLVFLRDGRLDGITPCRAFAEVLEQIEAAKIRCEGGLAQWTGGRGRAAQDRYS